MTRTLASTALLISLTSIPLLISILTLFPELFITHPILHFFLGLAPWWTAYLSARWYVRLAERSSPLYHPFGCLAQCYIWVFHWVVSLYHAFFVSKFPVRTYLVTVFCAGAVVLTEGLFYSLITVGASDPSTLGVYEKVRKSYGQGRRGTEGMAPAHEALYGERRDDDRQRSATLLNLTRQHPCGPLPPSDPAPLLSSTLRLPGTTRKYKGLVILINAWYLGDVGTQQQRWSRVRMPMHSRAMTM